MAVRSIPIYRAPGENVTIIEAYGLSTDTKPTEGVATGSSYVEVNTGKAYLYDEASGWTEVGA